MSYTFFFSFQLFSKPELIMCSEFRKTRTKKIHFSSFTVHFCFRFVPRVHHHNQSHFILTWYRMPLSKPDNNRKRWVGRKPKNMNKKKMLQNLQGSFIQYFISIFCNAHCYVICFIYKKNCNSKLVVAWWIKCATF